MAQATRTPPQQQQNGSSGGFSATLTLAAWRFRQVGWLLLLTCAGMIAAVTLVCTIPLYANVTMSAGIRSLLNASPGNSDIVVSSVSRKIDAATLASVSSHLNHEFTSNLGPYLIPGQFSLDTQAWSTTAITPGSNRQSVFHPTGDKYEMTLTSEDIARAASHLTLLQGHLPQTTTTNTHDLEIAVTPETSQALNLKLGSILSERTNFINGALQLAPRDIQLHVVGIFRLPQTPDAFWHGEDFQFYQPNDFVTVFRGLVANQSLIATFSQMSADPALQDYVFQLPLTVTWYYHLNSTHITATDLNAIVKGIANIQADDANNAALEQSPHLEQSQTYLPSPALTRYNELLPVAQLPVTSLLWLMLALLLFFITIMADLLVERQADAIAILRSRGASRGQIFGSLVAQGFLLSLVALLAGPLLALPTAYVLTQHTLSAADQGTLNMLSGNPLILALSVRGYALIAAGAVLLALIVAVTRSIGLDVLTARRESARTTRRPLWQRWNLDIGAAIIALTGAGVTAYVTNAGILDAHSALLLLSPLTLLGTVSLLIAGILLLLRFFPLLLGYAAKLTHGTRGAAPLLALAQMARAPRQSLRMTLMLAIATAFAIFTLICVASQQQRVPDIANYQAGADFSGTIPVNIITQAQLDDTTHAYEHVPGVLAASLGYVKTATAGNTTQGQSIDFHAVDANTFAQTAIWTPQDSTQSLTDLMRQLMTQRNSAIKQLLVPALVDAQSWNTLHLYPGAHFTLNFAVTDYADLINFVAIAQVQHIPSPNTGIGPAVLVDYRTFATVYKNKIANASSLSVPVNTVWLRTSDHPADLKSIYRVLQSGDLRLDFLYDRRAITADLYREPLFLTLTGVLLLGASINLLLALVGSLVASWQNVRNRLSSFTVLRALGATPFQVALALIWEQSIIYITAILLGIVFGAIFTVLVVPVLIFTSILPGDVTSAISSSAFYIAQSVPPIQIVVPPSLSIALIALLMLCLLTLLLMVRFVSQPSISQILRLNED